MEKSIIERTIQYIKDRTDDLMTIFLVERRNIKLKHVKQWLNLFADYYNKEKTS